jgi:hypothetical protein
MQIVIAAYGIQTNISLSYSRYLLISQAPQVIIQAEIPY